MRVRVRFLPDSPFLWRPAGELEQRRFLISIAAYDTLRAAMGPPGDLSLRLGPWPVSQDTPASTQAEPPRLALSANLDPASLAGSNYGRPAAWLACASLPGEPIAFAMLDSANSCLVVVRDGLGCIPICVATSAEGEIILAARAESIANHLDGRCRIDQARIADLLVGHLQWLDLSATFYQRIRRVPGGCIARISGEQIAIHRYWVPRVHALPSRWTASDYAKALGELLDSAVSSCLPNDGSLPAVMLSGGIDSNAVAGLAAAGLRQRGEAELPSYSVVHSADAKCSETAAIRQAMASPGLGATALDINAMGDALPVLQREMFDVDEPWDANLSLLRWVYRTAAANGHRYVLDGIDADSLLGEGDPVAEIARQFRRLQWRSAFRNARGMDQHWEGKGRVTRQLLGVAAWQALVPGRLRGALFARRRSLSAAARMSALLDGNPIHPEFARRVDLLARQSRYEWEEQEQGALDMRSPIVGVERYARAGARAHVVPLHPFLDTRVVEFCLALPHSQRLADGWPKFVLRSAMRGVVPDQVAWRHGKRHLGWRLTRALAAQLNPPLHIRLAQLREVLHHYVDPQWLKRLTIAPAVADEDIGWSIDLVALGEWLRVRRHRL